MTYIEKFNRYIDFVLNPTNERLTNQWVKKAVKRHLRDLERQGSEGFPFVFDEDKMSRFCKFAELMKQTKDKFAGKTLKLEDWQVFVFGSIYGWVYKETGLRRFRKAFIYVARKNGKSLMCAVPALWDLLSTPGAEVYCAANKREQSRRVWDDALHMVEQNSSLSSRLTIYNSTCTIINPKNAGVLSALSADKKNFDGKNSSLIIADELAAMPNYDIIKILQSGQASRPEPLILEITSGSDNLQSAGHQEFERSKKILDQVFEDESYFCILYCIEDEDNWEDEATWCKANPMLLCKNGVLNKDTIKKLAVEAKQNPGLRQEFITKQCARWSNPLKAWIQPDVWRKCESNPKKFDPNKVFSAIGAVDLSKVSDLTAFTVCIYQDKSFFLEHHFYFPIEQFNKKIHEDNELWQYWMQRGYVTATPGNTIDYTQMYNDIREAQEKYKLREIVYDPALASNTLVATLDRECNLVECPQTMKFISPYIKAMEEEIYKGNIVDNNPVLKWMINNVEIYRNGNDEVKIVKPDANAGSSKRVDGAVTSAMAIGRMKALINAGEIDTRTQEERMAATKKLLSNLKWG